jgi:polyisoprenoid-binding protein YceI
MMITNVRGVFTGVKGSIVYDSANPSASSVEAVIDAASINTQEAQRDGHLKSADFLDIEKFPTITFRSTKAEPGDNGEIKVTGDLTLHGVSRPVVLKVEGPTAEGKDPWGNTRIGASASTKFKRSEFRLTWNAALETGGLLVGDEVSINLEVQAIKAAATGA